LLIGRGNVIPAMMELKSTLAARLKVENIPWFESIQAGDLIGIQLIKRDEN